MSSLERKVSGKPLTKGWSVPVRLNTDATSHTSDFGDIGVYINYFK